jgi:Flp pilus assembly protein TadB
MEAVVSATIVGVLGLLGTVLSVWRSRAASTNQHVEQTAELKTIQRNQEVVLDLIKAHRETAELQLQAVHDRVDELAVGHDTLFGLLVEVDQKVTKSSNKRKVSTGLVEILQG